mmetsp:Transcript_44/g.116  ORF Transcript_44/g.116 Transcript_44/m.116 type:complete len:296 (-) Transcript_44:149-1036(-)
MCSMMPPSISRCTHRAKIQIRRGTKGKKKFHSPGAAPPMVITVTELSCSHHRGLHHPLQLQPPAARFLQLKAPFRLGLKLDGLHQPPAGPVALVAPSPAAACALTPQMLLTSLPAAGRTCLPGQRPALPVAQRFPQGCSPLSGQDPLQHPHPHLLEFLQAPASLGETLSHPGCPRLHPGALPAHSSWTAAASAPPAPQTPPASSSRLAGRAALPPAALSGHPAAEPARSACPACASPPAGCAQAQPTAPLLLGQGPHRLALKHWLSALDAPAEQHLLLQEAPGQACPDALALNLL